jgi:cytochrome o ubiquinol oxidase subunit 2
VEGQDLQGGALTRASYLQLEKPSEREPVRHYAKVDADLYDAILNRCVDRQQDVHEPDDGHRRRGGMGKPGAFNVATCRAGNPTPSTRPSVPPIPSRRCAPPKNEDA